MEFSDVDRPDEVIDTRDEAPDTTAELTCKHCGVALVAGSRGRKPTQCRPGEGCRSGSSGPTKSAVRRSATATDALADQAAAALCQINGLVAIGMMMVQFNRTAMSIHANEELFRTQLVEALRQDPKLCKKILASGGNFGATAGLVIAYGGLAATVVPTALMEYRERKEARNVAISESQG